MRKAQLVKTLTRLSLVASLLVALGACSWFQFPGVYKLSIQQGNIVTQEMLDQLEPGMTKRQVNFVLGTPLIIDSLHQDRWDYFYSVRDSKGETTTEHLAVFFDGDQFTHFEGEAQNGTLPEDTELPPEEIDI